MGAGQSPTDRYLSTYGSQEVPTSGRMNVVPSSLSNRKSLMGKLILEAYICHMAAKSTYVYITYCRR